MGLALRQLGGQSERSSYESLSQLSYSELKGNLGAAVLMAESNPLDNQSDGPGERMEPLRAYTKAHPDDAGALAVLCQLSTSGIRGHWMPDPKVKPIVHADKWRTNALRALEEAQAGAKLEPTNWYFRLCEAHFLLALGRKDEISKVLDAAPLPTRYDDHVSEEVEAINGYLDSGFWKGTAIERMSRMAGLLFPHFSGFREVAKGELAYTNRDPKVRARWMRIGVTLFDDSDTLIGLLVGKAVTAIGANEQESLDKSIPAAQRGPQLVSMFDRFLSTYADELTNDESDRIGHVLNTKFDSELTSDADVARGVLLTPPTFAILCGSLLALVGATLTLIPFRVPTKHWWISPLAIGLASASFALLATKAPVAQSLPMTMALFSDVEDNRDQMIQIGFIVVIGLMASMAAFFNDQSSHRAQTVPSIVVLTILAALIPALVMPCLFVCFALAAVTDSGQFNRPVTVAALIISAIAWQFMGLGMGGTVVWILTALVWGVFAEKRDHFSLTAAVAVLGLVVAGFSSVRIDHLMNGGQWNDDKAIQSMRI